VLEAIDSALGQELGVPFEVVVVDDGSTDGTAAVLQARKRQAGDPLTVLALRENQGGGAARNHGINHSSGEFIYMLDADNVLPEGCVAPQLELARRTQAPAVSVASVQFFGGDGRDLLHVWQMEERCGQSGIDEMFRSIRVPASHGNYLFRRSTFDQVHGYEEGRGAMDAWTFGFKHVAHGLPLLIAPETSYLHRVDRPGHDSYWTREQRSGTNDQNALQTVLQYADLLPPTIAGRVRLLAPDAKLMELIEAGAFLPENDLDDVLLKLEKQRDGRSLIGALRGLVGRVKGSA
jgi:glycosyltransferase involved in cell wall biosynthesis